ncbi:MAG: helix-turn-helix transcriptional regulator [Tenericutes bacterium]|nr:helix-turn-helix transcriptional regulator [Mycoplasmatota bacterium]
MQELKTQDSLNKFFISTSLKRLRVKHNLSTYDVAKIIEKSRQAYSNYETGLRDIGIYDLIKLSGFYNVSIDVIVGNPYALMNDKSIAYRYFEYVENELKEVMPLCISTIRDDVIVVKQNDLLSDFFWRTDTNQQSLVMLFDYYNKTYISKVFYNSSGGGHFYINEEPLYFNKARAENIIYKGVYFATLDKKMDIKHFF